MSLFVLLGIVRERKFHSGKLQINKTNAVSFRRISKNIIHGQHKLFEHCAFVNVEHVVQEPREGALVVGQAKNSNVKIELTQ